MALFLLINKADVNLPNIFANRTSPDNEGKLDPRVLIRINNEEDFNYPRALQKASNYTLNLTLNLDFADSENARLILKRVLKKLALIDSNALTKSIDRGRYSHYESIIPMLICELAIRNEHKKITDLQNHFGTSIQDIDKISFSNFLINRKFTLRQLEIATKGLENLVNCKLLDPIKLPQFIIMLEHHAPFSLSPGCVPIQLRSPLEKVVANSINQRRTLEELFAELQYYLHSEQFLTPVLIERDNSIKDGAQRDHIKQMQDIFKLPEYLDGTEHELLLKLACSHQASQNTAAVLLGEILIFHADQAVKKSPESDPVVYLNKKQTVVCARILRKLYTLTDTERMLIASHSNLVIIQRTVLDEIQEQNKILRKEMQQLALFIKETLTSQTNLETNNKEEPESNKRLGKLSLFTN